MSDNAVSLQTRRLDARVKVQETHWKRKTKRLAIFSNFNKLKLIVMIMMKKGIKIYLGLNMSVDDPMETNDHILDT